MMDITNYLILTGLGLFSGLLAGVFGVGGGVILVPTIKALGYSPVQAVATSSLAIIMTSISGSIQNWRMGNFDVKKVLLLALPSIFTAQLGALLANAVAPKVLLISFSIFLLINILLTQIKKNIISKIKVAHAQKDRFNPILANLLTGGITGFLAGFFGIGGGIILVPLQILLLQEEIKKAIQISLGVIIITSISACVQHTAQGNVLFIEGLILGLGGFVGAQISARFLPKLPNRVINFGFNLMLATLSVYVMYQALR